MTVHRSTVQRLIDKLAETANVPLASAKAVAAELYHDPQIHQLELDRIFRTGWLCAGIASEIPKAGDYLSFSIAEQPIFVIRGKDGALRSFSSVCLHRMMMLVEGSGNCRRLVCPYHGWTYDETGRLIGAGHMDQTAHFNKADYKLPEIRTELWEGWIYVTLDRTAPSVESQLADLRPVVQRYRMADYVPVVTQDHVWQTNWKFLCENFMEGYHLPVAHRATVGAWFPAEETTFPDRVFEGFTYQSFLKDETATYGRAHIDNNHLTNEWRYTSVMPTVFPSHMYVLAPDHMWYLSLRPKGVDEVHVRFGASLAPEVMESLGEGREAFLSELVSFFDKVNAEDRFLVEGMHKGSAAPMATTGPLSWLEREVHDFDRYLFRKLTES